MPSAPVITIWIHGTLPEHIFPLLGYFNNIELVNNFFYCKPGLHKASSYNSKFHHKSLAKSIAQGNAKKYPFSHFYIFGWSGKLGSNERLQAAHQLHAQLHQLIKKYKTRFKQNPFIRIITHSHGGNVVLNLARIQRKNDPHIDELILLAIPVQHETEEYVHNPLFKKIYSLHSHGDLLQVADPQGLPTWWQSIKEVLKMPSQKKMHEAFKIMEEKDLFSHRHFNTHENIVQARIQFGSRSLFHIEFLFLSFTKHIPAIMESLTQEKKRKKLEIDDQDWVISLE